VPPAGPACCVKLQRTRRFGARVAAAALQRSRWALREALPLQQAVVMHLLSRQLPLLRRRRARAQPRKETQTRGWLSVRLALRRHRLAQREDWPRRLASAARRRRPGGPSRTNARSRGWLSWATPEAAETRLTRGTGHFRFAYETAGPAIDWLIETLGKGEHRSGRSFAAQAVYKWPQILTRSTSQLQAGWEMVVHSREAGGLGLSVEVAQQRVASFPPVLHYSKEFMEKRAAFLETLGVTDGRAAIGSRFQLLSVSESTLRNGAEWLRAQGLDVLRMTSSHPQLLYLSPQGLSAKLDFMRNIVGLSTSEIASGVLAASFDNVMRPRYFYALQRGVEQRYAFGSLVKCTDASFLKMAHSLAKGVHATAEDVAAYQAHIATPAFRAYMDEQEAAIRAERASRLS
jgi:hypothetical protein